jgi:hypothetical protein
VTLTTMSRYLSVVACCFVVGTGTACPPDDDEIEVNVLSILASENRKEVEPKLTEFAKQARKKDSSLTGFRLDRATSKKLKLGETEKFPVAGDQVVEVTINKERNEKGRIVLTIKPPKLAQITYECVCDKYFSMATQHYEGKEKDREQLFIAVMAKPCLPKK